MISGLIFSQGLWQFPKIRGPFLVVLIIRALLIGGSILEPLICGTSPIGSSANTGLPLDPRPRHFFGRRFEAARPLPPAATLPRPVSPKAEAALASIITTRWRRRKQK